MNHDTPYWLCAKLYREKLEQAECRIEILKENCEGMDGLEDAIKTLQAENERLKAEVSLQKAFVAQHLQEIVQQREDIGRLMADAARLDWLDRVHCGLDHRQYEYRHYTGPGFRPARDTIDAAMKGYCSELEKKVGFGEGSDAFWEFVENKRKGGK